MRFLPAAIFALALLTVVACDSVNYKGDGKLIDNGVNAATDRYVVDLGPVSLKASTSATFKLANLPKENFVVGIDLTAPAGTKLNSKAIAPVVAISLLEDGKVIFAREGKLNEWTWSDDPVGDRAFVYGRKQPETYFDAARGRTYELRFAVKQPDQSNQAYSAKLLAKSGGWK